MYGYLYKSYGKDYRPKYDLCQRNRCIERGNVRNDGKAMRETNSDLKGNIRDYATINELICPSNMENLNAVFIEQDMSQGERLVKLNPIAIHQMSVLENSDNNERKLLKHELRKGEYERFVTVLFWAFQYSADGKAIRQGNLLWSSYDLREICIFIQRLKFPLNLKLGKAVKTRLFE